MLRLLICACLLTATCLAQEDFHLKIAEKLAIPHHIRHAFDYPAINFNQMLANRRAPASPQQAFSAPQPAPQPARQPLRPATNFASQPSSGFAQQPSGGFARQPSSGFASQPSGFSGRPSQGAPVRQTRFFNMFTPNSRPFGLERRDS